MDNINNLEKVTLIDEDGNDVVFEIITKLDIEDKEYVIVAPEGQEDVDAIALRIDKDENGEDILLTVEDEDEFNLVAEAYEILFSEE